MLQVSPPASSSRSSIRRMGRAASRTPSRAGSLLSCSARRQDDPLRARPQDGRFRRVRVLPHIGEALGGSRQQCFPSPMTRHDFEAWLDHHLDQAVLVEWRELDGGLVTDKISMTGALCKDGEGEYHAGEAHIDLGDFEVADFGGDGVIVELAQENAELYIAVS